jgi:hypothetical protein
MYISITKFYFQISIALYVTRESIYDERHRTWKKTFMNHVHWTEQ